MVKIVKMATSLRGNTKRQGIAVNKLNFKQSELMSQDRKGEMRPEGLVI